MTDGGAGYEIVVVGSIGPRSLRALGAVDVAATGPEGTRLVGRFVDQPVLHAVLERIHDLGLELVRVRRLP